MSQTPKASVVIVSRNRPEALAKLIVALRYQRDAQFELIVVSNAQPSAYMPPDIRKELAHHIFFDEPNISRARNLGIQCASGEVIAFIDDDAIPEPLWLLHLVSAFKDPKIGVAGGFVRGRNGISFQWQAIETNAFGKDFPLQNAEPISRGIRDGHILKVQGTNMAFRATALKALGGFDEQIAYYLDEVDMCWRMAQAGWETQILPDAEVTHGYLESAGRSSNRAPKSLRRLGLSLNYFLAKQSCQNAETEKQAFLKGQHTRLIRFMEIGHLEPRQVVEMLADLKRALAEAPPTDPILAKFEEGVSFRAFPTYAADPCVFFGNIWSRKALRKKAKSAAQQGQAVQLYIFSRSSLFHRRRFVDAGYWEQTGGLFGRSDRGQKLVSFRHKTIKARTAVELDRLEGRAFATNEISKLRSKFE